MIGPDRPKLDERLDPFEEDRPLTAEDRAFFAALEAAAPDAPRTDEVTWARLQRSIAAERAANSPAWWRKPAVAPWQMAASIAAALAIAIIPAQLSRVADEQSEARYVTAGEASGGERLKVAFIEDAPEAEIRALLTAINAEFVAGPSALGFYEIAVRDGAIEEALETLRGADGVVDFAGRP